MADWVPQAQGDSLGVVFSLTVGATDVVALQGLAHNCLATILPLLPEGVGVKRDLEDITVRVRSLMQTHVVDSPEEP